MDRCARLVRSSLQEWADFFFFIRWFKDFIASVAHAFVDLFIIALMQLFSNVSTL